MVKEVFFLLLPEMGGSLETWWLRGFPLSIEGKEKNINRTAKQAKSAQKAVRGKHVTRDKGQIV